MVDTFLNWLSHWDAIAALMAALITFIGLGVCSFASRYMKGDTTYRLFFVRLILLITSLCVMVSADNVILLLVAWSLSNALLVRLMIHKSSWKAAQTSGVLAARNYLLSTCFMASGFALLYVITHHTSVNAIVHHATSSELMLPALILILLAAMAQSAIWPFHRWLLSSLNSPTPVSAIMHAGLVNGGGFLLVRFAPLYLRYPTLLAFIFCIGIMTALCGTLWKLMQSDVKRMLACSTLGQMGFMLAQCGLGLFPAAVAHLLWHGMFKAYLFLESGSAAQEKRFDLGYPPKLLAFMGALLCGFAGSVAFDYITLNSWVAGDSSLVLVVVSFIAASQFALPLLRFNTVQNLPIALVCTVAVGLFYGFSVHVVAVIMHPMGLMQPQPLTYVHIVGIIALGATWLALLFFRHRAKTSNLPSWMLKGYVTALNASQPHSSTVTAHRNHYQYL
jgi:NAD(P)H-quinone oxidoreductase subunit 5